MSELTVYKSIEIDAPAARVWEVLTNPVLSCQWIEQFWPGFGALESDWQTGSVMRWKTADGEIDLESQILAIQTARLLRYSFTMPEDIVTLALEERDGQTVLSVTHGDFSKKPDAEECYAGALAGWAMNLPNIKGLAENKSG
ncbi:MAG: SRPBCC domain-containing protein [Litorilinea sp.]